MRVTRKTIFLLMMLLCVVTVRSASAASYVPGEALVVFRKAPEAVVTAASVERGLESFRVASLAAASGARMVRAYGALSEAGDGIFALVRSESSTTEQLVEALKARPDVVAASPNYLVRALREPNDPEFLSDQLWGLRAIRAPEAWDITMGGADVYVAVVDSGIRTDHEDLKDNIAAEFCRNFTQAGENMPAIPSDYIDANGHGTHVAGTIGAVGDNAKGVVGVNWTTRLIALRVLGADGVGLISWGIDAINYLLGILRAQPQMKIPAINLSLSFYADLSPQKVRLDPYGRAFKALDDLNRTVIVVAASNQGLEVGKPAPYTDPEDPQKPDYRKGDYCYPASLTGLNNLIVVGAAASDGSAASFSNWSPTAVHLAAPGRRILSTVFPEADDFGKPYGTWYGLMSGTSMAAPHVAGAVALLASRVPDATAHQLKEALLQGADADRNPVATAKTNTAGANLSRYGYLDVKRALDILIESRDVLPPQGSEPSLPPEQKDPLMPGPDPQARPSSGGGGCNTGLGFSALAFGALWACLALRRGHWLRREH